MGKKTYGTMPSDHRDHFYSEPLQLCEPCTGEALTDTGCTCSDIEQTLLWWRNAAAFLDVNVWRHTSPSPLRKLYVPRWWRGVRLDRGAEWLTVDYYLPDCRQILHGERKPLASRIRYVKMYLKNSISPNSNIRLLAKIKRTLVSEYILTRYIVRYHIEKSGLIVNCEIHTTNFLVGTLKRQFSINWFLIFIIMNIYHYFHNP